MGHTPSNQVTTVLWLLSDRRVSSETAINSTLASSRYRCAHLIHHLKNMDVAVIAAPITNHFANYKHYDAVVIGKFFTAHDAKLAPLIAQETRLILDCCDISSSITKGYFAKAAQSAHAIVAGSQYIQSFLHRHHGLEAQVIPDCPILPPQIPKAHVTPNPKMVWFGHGANIRTLRENLTPEILRNLTVVSNREIPGATNYKWSPATVSNALFECSIALFPTLDTVYHQAKGLNRFMDAVLASVVPICHEHPAWSTAFPDLKTFKTLTEGIDWYNENTAEAVKMTSKIQDIIRSQYSPTQIASQWEAIFSQD